MIPIDPPTALQLHRERSARLRATTPRRPARRTGLLTGGRPGRRRDAATAPVLRPAPACP